MAMRGILIKISDELEQDQVSAGLGNFRPHAPQNSA
jgi:hypothetical protein